MTEINIQKKASSNAIPFLVAIIVAGLIGWWVIGVRNRDRGTGVADASATAMASAAGPAAASSTVMGSQQPGVITDLATLSSTPESELVGRQVVLSSIPVVATVGDGAFWAGAETLANNARGNIFVVRGNQSSSYSLPNGSIQAGTPVVIYGVVRKMAPEPGQPSRDWSLTGADRAEVAKQPVYVMADSVRLAP